ncbi:MAG TPA: M28 family peptidase [Longimicrobiaceae bacterium]
MESTPVLTPAPEHAPNATHGAGSAAPRQRGLVWLAAAALLATVLALVEWTDRPPSPAPASVAATEFSEARARPTLETLAGRIGKRVIGTAGADSAAAYLVATLRAIPGVEVQVQDSAWTDLSPWIPGALDLYRTRNVLARLPGDSASAVLLSAHYDSPPESFGAADNGVAVASAVEILRALAAGPRPGHSVVVNFNDGEEAGLLGSNAFLEHPWARDVRAFVNLESAGAGGKAVLFQAGPGNDWLTEEYARSVPRPYGTVLAQDIFQSGLIPSDTDFRVYRDQGRMRGLDVALYQDGYAYHTDLDRVERVQPGSMQHMGENTLALVRELATGPLPGNVGGAPAVYYDLLGATMFAYSAGTATVLTLLALVLAAAALVVAVRRTPLTAGRAAAGLGVTVAATLAGIVLPIVAALLLSMVLGRPHGWFSAPWLGWAAFGSLALAAFLFVHGVWERRSERRGRGADTALAALAGSTLFWALLLVLFTLGGIGTAYLALWWTISGAAGLLIWALAPRARWAALVVAWLPAALLTAQVQAVLLKLFAPVAGRFPLPFPFDPIIALLVALPTVWLAAAGAAALHRGGRLRLASGVLAALGLVAMAAMAVRSPYSETRPKRLEVTHAVSDTASLLLVAAADAIGPQAALAGVDGPPFRARGLSLARPAPRPALPAPSVQVANEGTQGDVRTVRLRVSRGSWRMMSLRIPAERIVGWSLGGSLPPRPRNGFYSVRIFPPSAAGQDVVLQIRGAEPLRVDATETFAPMTTPASEQLVRQLPAWATPSTSVSRRTPLEM